jgi:hypothetical protein
MGFHGDFMHINSGATLADLEFLHETRRRGKENVSSPRHVWASFPRRRKLDDTRTKGLRPFHRVRRGRGSRRAGSVGRRGSWTRLLRRARRLVKIILRDSYVALKSSVRVSLLMYWIGIRKLQR